MNQRKPEGHLQNAIALDAHQYELNLSEPPALLEPGDLLKVSGKLKNVSGRDWDIFIDDKETIKIGIQVYEENKPGRQEFRSSLGVDKFVDGATIEFECLIDTKPLKQGKIRLVFDVVAECYYWFEEKGAKPETITVQILARTAGNLIKVGNQLKREGKLAEAILEYRQAIELNPNFSWAYYNLGDALVKKGYINEAIGKYKKAIELNCDSYFWFYHDLGIALHTQGKIDQAINCFKKAKQLLKSKDNLTRQKYKYLRDSFLAKARLSLSGQSTYLSKKFTDLIDPDNINYILELGSRDGIDAVYLSKYYLCQVDAFECNPECIEICLNNLRAYTNINLVTKAVWDRNETISFYVTTNGNIGASSCFEETGDYPFEKYNPYQISVEAIRLDSYLKRSPDLICMDLQGAELNALKGLGEFLKGVKYIITELEVKPLYKNQCLFDDVVEFLKKGGFELQKYIPVYHKWFGDALFVNKSLVKIPLLTERMTNVNYNLSINLQQHERKIFSQNGEDGVIKKIFEVIKTTNKYYVEFGVENANECNTRNLRENCGWSGLLMDGGYENKEIGLYQEFITAENINNLFQKYNVPQEFDLLSIDIDYNDFYVWKSLDEIYQTRVVIIEYNASHLPTEDKVVKYDPNAVWDTTNYFGASIRALYNLGKRKGYSLIYANNQGVNLFFVKSSILSQIEHSFKDTNNIFLIYNSPKYGSDISGGHRADDKNRKYVTSGEILLQ